jgi:hypothetical protein
MLVKDVDLKENLKVIDPRTGHVGYYKGDYEGGVFLSAAASSMKTVIPIEVSKDEFLEWKVASETDKTTIAYLIKQQKR